VDGTWLPATAREMAFQMQHSTSREAEASGRPVGSVTLHVLVGRAGGLPQ